jgi:ABC-type uncharacterized transport system involved in gliding motility auxiliary subunit
MNILKKLVDFLAPVGIVLALGALAWSRTSSRPLPGGLRPWLIAGLALVLVHLVLRWEDVARGLGRRQLKYGTNALVLVLAVLGILVGINWIAAQYTKRFDVTKNRRFSLSDQTRKVVSGLAEDVKITYFQRSGEGVQGRDRLKEYELLSKRLKVDFVDPVRSPTVAIAYEALGPYPIVVVERGERRERITNDSEQDLTNVLVKITREGKKTACFVEGSGERSPEDTGAYGLSGAKAALTRSQYEVKSVYLLREQKIPEDCTTLVVAGPDSDPQTEVIDLVRGYVAAGGRALVMVEPELKKPFPNLVGLLKAWNIDAGNDLAVDRQGYRSPLAPLVIDYPYHEITKDMRGLGTVYAEARSIEPGKENVDGVYAQALVRTSAQSWAKPDPAKKLPKTLDDVQYDEKTDRIGPIGLAAAVTVRAPAPAPTPTPSPAPSPEPEQPKPREGRVLVYGDADFAANRLLGFEGNLDLFLNGMAWLAEESDLISIRPKDPENQTLVMTDVDRQNVGWLALAILPGLFVVLGVFSWWRRR